MDIRSYNREAWNKEVQKGNPWTLPVSHAQVEQAKQGIWNIVLTPSIHVPKRWFPHFKDQPVLCLASGGGQQAPILAAAGGKVTCLDNSPLQLERDREVAQREGLIITTVEGDMRDLSMFPDNHFVLIFHPVSNLFVPDIQPVWREAFRVLQPGGVLLSGFSNPINYIFDWQKIEEEKKLEVKYHLPYSDIEDLPKDQLEAYMNENNPLEYSHSFNDQLGGQIDAGFYITGFFEDRDPFGLIGQYMPTFFAVKAQKPLSM
ncbi:MAG TPA: class I SAM-dependent methyltransferase [Anaerolineaceae bacterium]|nr:class I SAM-dependent methyltransferase [Anaerolineaceae bacterium]